MIDLDIETRDRMARMQPSRTQLSIRRSHGAAHMLPPSAHQSTPVLRLLSTGSTRGTAGARLWHRLPDCPSPTDGEPAATLRAYRIQSSSCQGLTCAEFGTFQTLKPDTSIFLAPEAWRAPGLAMKAQCTDAHLLHSLMDPCGSCTPVLQQSSAALCRVSAVHSLTALV